MDTLEHPDLNKEVIKMILTKEEARWLDDKWNDFYYYFDVESMYPIDQEIFQKYWKKIIRGKTMNVRTYELNSFEFTEEVLMAFIWS